MLTGGPFFCWKYLIYKNNGEFNIYVEKYCFFFRVWCAYDQKQKGGFHVGFLLINLIIYF